MTKDLEVYLHSTLVAMRTHLEAFSGVESMILIQPNSGDAIVRKLSKNMRKKMLGPFTK